MKKLVLYSACAGVAVVAVYAYYAMQYASTDPTNDPAQAGQLNSPLDDLTAAMDNATDTSSATDAATAQANETAFLATIAYSEGADYNVLYGGGTFDDYSTHPNQAVTAGGWTSTAAGRYQILYKTWQYLCTKLGLSDFSPATQDAMALELIAEKAALSDVQAGNFADAVAKCAKTWASLPGSPYGQPTHPLSTLATVYASNGGTNSAG